MHSFIKNLVVFSSFGLIPLSILLAFYCVLDPFRIVRSYDSFYGETMGVALNRDYVSTATFINNRKKVNYNSFILGNSRSLFYYVSDWQRFLPANSACFHFDASGESLWALGKKVAFLDSVGVKIENVLLVLDNETLRRDGPRNGHLFMISPMLIGDDNFLIFHKASFKAFLSPRFLVEYVGFLFTGRVKAGSRYLDERSLNYDPLSNEIRFDYMEKQIADNRYYTPERTALFYTRGKQEKHSPSVIKNPHKRILSDIQSVLRRHNSHLKVVISPLYDQLKLDDQDLNYLIDLFGQENVFDFSGVNDFTSDFNNYYEISHYRPHVARAILGEIYGSR